MEQTTATVAAAKTKNVLKKEDLTLALLQEELLLDTETGYFYAKKDGIRHRIGDWVGQLNVATGLYKVQFHGTVYNGKQLAGFYATGVWDESLAGRRGAPGSATPKEPKVHVPRVVPVITDEQREAAKVALAAKKAALKAKKEAAKAATVDAAAQA